MNRIWFFAVIIHTIHAQFFGQGTLERVLSDYMANYPHFHMLAMEEPRYRKYFGTCSWQSSASSLGEYGMGLSLMHTKLNCSEDFTTRSWNGTFPCVLQRKNNTLNCTGPLPLWAENYIWTVEDYGKKPSAPWRGSFPDAPSIQIHNAVPFEGEMTCHSLVGLALARVIQSTAMYEGQGVMSCKTVRKKCYVKVTTQEGHLGIAVNARGVDKSRLNAAPVHVQWNATVDISGALLLSVKGREAVSYSRRVLAGTRVEFSGVKRSVYATSLTSLQSRLCALSRMTSVCAVMNSLSEKELRTLGNVTGFDVRHWMVLRKPKRVLVTGTVLGTRGLLEGSYEAQALRSEEASWTELPLGMYDACRGALHMYADCGRELKVDGAPKMGNYKGDVIHYPFP